MYPSKSFQNNSTAQKVWAGTVTIRPRAHSSLQLGVVFTTRVFVFLHHVRVRKPGSKPCVWQLHFINKHLNHMHFKYTATSQGGPRPRASKAGLIR
mgnify:CR=1 FL=1